MHKIEKEHILYEQINYLPKFNALRAQIPLARQDVITKKGGIKTKSASFSRDAPNILKI
jgi:hypothetical protein